MIALYAAGQRDFGENYVQELVSKAQHFREKGMDDVRFHFIGGLQTNKVKALLPWVAAIHSCDSIRVLREIEKRASLLGREVGVYFQVNIDEEESKGGFRESDLPLVSEALREMHFIRPLGLMAIPDPDGNPERAFERMRVLSDLHGAVLGRGLSMGMSGDYEAAIASGSTVVRIGTALFGERKSGDR